MPVDHTVVLGLNERIVRLERLVVEMAEQLFWGPGRSSTHDTFKKRIAELRDELEAEERQ